MAGADSQETSIDVAAALIQDGAGRYLIAQRAAGSHLGGLWEFPGGKREPGETLEGCLRRELTEELGADFTVSERIESVTSRYPGRTIVLHFFRCYVRSGTIEPREGQALAWVEPARLTEYAFPPADRELIATLGASGQRG